MEQSQNEFYFNYKPNIAKNIPNRAIARPAFCNIALLLPSVNIKITKSINQRIPPINIKNRLIIEMKI